MDNRSQGGAGCEVDVRSTGRVCRQSREADEVTRIEDTCNTAHNRRAARARIRACRTAAGKRRNAGKVCCAGDPFVCPYKVIHAELFVVAKRQFADDSTKRDLRRFDVHLVQNFFNFHYHVPVAEHDDRVRAWVGNDLGIADHNRFRGRVDWLSRKFL